MAGYGCCPGKVSFSYTEIETGCISRMMLDAVTVKPCLDPDFNITSLNTVVKGNISTNDEVVAGMTYGAITISLEKPYGSIPYFALNPDGSYEFSATIAGEYVYRVSVCLTSRPFDCNFSELSIKVVDPFNFDAKPIGNVDIATTNLVSNTEMGEPVILDPFVNDRCLKGTGCTMDTNTMLILTNPKYGVASLLPKWFSILYVQSSL